MSRPHVFSARLCFGVLLVGLALSTGIQAQAPASAPELSELVPIWEQPDQPLIPEIISTYGWDVDYLFYLILWITLFFMVLVLGLFFYFLVRYRYQEGRRATYTHGNNKLEVFWTVGTAAILIYLAFIQRETWSEIRQELPEESKSFLVNVFAEQFVWHFTYPGKDGKFEATSLQNVFPGINPVGLENSDNDVYLQDLVVPVDTPVILKLHALGKYDQDTGEETLPVLHSFFASNVRLKLDIVPFYPQKVWFHILPGKRGIYEINCAELCGLGHYTMRANLKVLSDAELEKELGYNWREHPATFAGPDTTEK